MDVRKTLREICVDVFNTSDFPMEDATTPETFPGWDSLEHINLIDQITESFGIYIELEEMIEMNSIGAIIGVIERKLSE